MSFGAIDMLISKSCFQSGDSSFTPTYITSHHIIDSNMAEKKTFVVWAPRQSDPGALERRTAAREEHLKHMGRITAQGTLSAWWCPFT